jgi:glycine betaine/choline ABC-type transport system substrate-binding protein
VSDKALAAHGPDLEAAINAVTNVLTTPAMRRMNAAVDLSHRSPAAVAGEFLRAQRLG